MAYDDKNELQSRYAQRREKLWFFSNEINKLWGEIQSIPETVDQENIQKSFIWERLNPLHGQITYYLNEYLKHHQQ